MKPKSSPLWNYYEEIDANFAKCKLCSKLYSRGGRSTTPLRNHLKSKHVEKYAELCDIETNKKQPEAASSPTPLQAAKKQLTIQESVKKAQQWDSSHPKSKEMDKLIAEMLALQNLSFNFVDGVGFRRVMHAALPKYHLKGRTFFTSYLCDDLYPKISRKIQEVLQQFTKISFTSDIWTEPSANVSLLSLTAHGVTQDFHRMQIILKCDSMHERHTGDIICEKFKSMLDEWNITLDNIHCFTRDGGSNMVKALNLANITNIDCTVHQVQLCVRTVLDKQDEFSILISKCKKIATHFNHSQIAQVELKNIQQQLNQPEVCVIQDCPTR